MLLQVAAVQAASTGFRAMYLRGVGSVVSLASRLALEITSTGSQETIHIPEGCGELREWVGERELKPVIRWDTTIKNKTFEGTLVVPVEAYEDDQLGVYKGQAETLGVAAASHPDKLLIDLLVAGFTAVGYDEVAFFSASHPLQSGSQTNLQTGALSATTFNEALVKLQSLTDYYGKPLAIAKKKLVLVVGPSNRATAKSIVSLDTLSGGGGNPNYGEAEVIIDDRLIGAHATKWFVMVADGPARPVILQIRRKANFVTVSDLTSESVFLRREILHGVDGRWNVGYGFYQLAVGSLGT